MSLIMVRYLDRMEHMCHWLEFEKKPVHIRFGGDGDFGMRETGRVFRLLVPYLAWRQVWYCNGFASNLIVSRIGCMTELDTSEVIMNNMVKSPDESDFPHMHLAVVEGDNHIESPYYFSSNELSILFVNPYSKDEFDEDLQFIMEIDGPAEFVDGGTIGCDGNKRVAARLLDNNGEVSLVMKDASATVKVWAGWATGQNAVRLTPNLILQPGHKDNSDTAEGGDGPASNARGAGGREDTNNAGKAGEFERGEAKNRPRGDSEHLSPAETGPTAGHDSTDRGADHVEGRGTISDRLQQKQAELNSKRRSKEDKHRERPRRFDLDSYIYACAFLTLTLGSIVLSLGRKKEKGRRDQ